jgi:plasmid stabilization system protein ParE
MKVKFTLHWSDRAENKFREIIKRIVKEFGSNAAEKFIAKVEQSIAALVEMPEAFPKTSARKNVRRCVISKQTTAFYFVTKDTVEIVTLFHTRQSPKKLKKELK